MKEMTKGLLYVSLFVLVKSIVLLLLLSNWQSYGTKPFNMQQKLNFGKLVYLTVVVVSLGAFIVTTVDLFVKYLDESTGFNIVEHVKTELELPAATICITDVFQNVDTDTGPNEILSNLTAHTFSADHIFHEDFETLKEKFIIQETFNYKNGHCYTLRSLKQAKAGSGAPQLYLKLKKAHKYKVLDIGNAYFKPEF